MKKASFPFKRFVKAHERWLTFAGAFIIVMTFIIKEGLHERWKAHAEALDTAEYMYSLSTLMASTDVKVIEIQRELRSVGYRVFNPKLKPTDGLDRLMSYGDADLTRLSSSLANSMILVRQLPELRGLETECLTYEQAIDDAGKERDFYVNTPRWDLDQMLKTRSEWHYTSKGPVDSHNLFKPPANYLEKTPPLFLALNRNDESFALLRDDVHHFAKRVLDQATAIREKEEYRSRITWWLSTALFAIGWGFGLLGKIYGVGGGE